MKREMSTRGAELTLPHLGEKRGKRGKNRGRKSEARRGESEEQVNYIIEWRRKKGKEREHWQ